LLAFVSAVDSEAAEVLSKSVTLDVLRDSSEMNRLISGDSLGLWTMGGGRCRKVASGLLDGGKDRRTVSRITAECVPDDRLVNCRDIADCHDGCDACVRLKFFA